MLDDWLTEDDPSTTVFSLKLPFSKTLITRGPKILSRVGMRITLLPISRLHDRHIFGTHPEGDSEDENRAPTMADTIRAKRAARKAADRQAARDIRSLCSPPTFVVIVC